ncbi:MAG: D-alanine-D-alanine ligase [Berkelbacteria bacterium GW2011_GWA1_36_9]|uniref:D-alanine-D-alanine ligase n=1 Tax=Berkelbacteria bacterium GW2011_GWA1_36_9 TaxID=1618331 RepID=A0A0G0I0M3_9BACT|nr:MAG: D-alanine-D-alanine ligase [Berkelbacteria bacterium GW2011_GWA1_36_9]
MKRVLVLYNLAERLEKGVPSDLVCEQEITIIVPLVAELLNKKGYRVETLKADLDLWEVLKKRRGDFDIVFNLAEGFGGANSNEVFVPALLEALRIPFTGASLHNFVITHDKAKANIVLSAHGVPTPRHSVFYPGQEIISKGLHFPLIVKPVYEGASIGITYNSVVSGHNDLVNRVCNVFHVYRQPALVEEFIEGREISVGCLGNRTNIHLFPPLEFVFADSVPVLRRIRSYEYKWDGGKEAMARVDLPKDLIDRFLEYTRTAFLVTDCQDYARMDYRLSKTGQIFLLEVNCNPGIGPNSHGLNNTLTMMANYDGYSFEDFIEKILITAQERYAF